jgi:hypothetical protein
MLGGIQLSVDLWCQETNSLARPQHRRVKSRSRVRLEFDLVRKSIEACSLFIKGLESQKSVPQPTMTDANCRSTLTPCPTVCAGCSAEQGEGHGPTSQPRNSCLSQGVP